jgi:hypothetical protein
MAGSRILADARDPSVSLTEGRRDWQPEGQEINAKWEIRLDRRRWT